MARLRAGNGAELLAADGIGAADVLFEDGAVERARAGGADAEGIPENALRLPDCQALCELLGIGRGIAGELEGLDGEDGGGGVVPVAAAAGRDGEARDDDIGPELADDANDVAKHGVAVPEAERLLRRLRETEVDGAGEELAAVVEAAGGEEFLGAQHAEFLVKVLAEFILAAVAARERQVGGAVAAAEGEVGDELGVLIVRVRGDVEDGAGGAEAAQFLRDAGRCQEFGSMTERGDEGAGQGHGEKQRTEEFHGVVPGRAAKARAPVRTGPWGYSCAPDRAGDDPGRQRNRTYLRLAMSALFSRVYSSLREAGDLVSSLMRSSVR
jgi:hypothetical protein